MKFYVNKDKTKLILKENTPEEYNILKGWLTPYVTNYKYMPQYKFSRWDGKIDFFNNGIINIGLWHECYKCCKENNFKFEIININDFPRDEKIKVEDVKNFSDDFFKEYKLHDKIFKPYDFQIECVYKMLKYKLGIIEVPTSGGKTLIASLFIFFILRKINPKYKILIIVPSILLVRQFYNDIINYNWGFNKENKNPIDINILEIMSDKPQILNTQSNPNIYIGTFQSISKFGTSNFYPHFFKNFNVVIVDESHTAKSKSLVKILSKTFGYSEYRIGLSGTYPNDKSAEYISIQSVLGAKIYSISPLELIQRGIISNVKILCLLLNYNDIDFSNNVNKIKRRGDGKMAFELEKKYIQNSDKRKNLILKLLTNISGNSLILFHNIDFGTNIYDFLRSNLLNCNIYYIDGETPLNKREYIKSQMEITKENTNQILIASFGTMSTGVSIKAIKNVFFIDSFKSPRIILQSIGRALRLHKIKEGNNATIFDIVDIFHEKHKNILYNHYISRKNNLYIKQKFIFEEIKINL